MADSGYVQSTSSSFVVHAASHAAELANGMPVVILVCPFLSPGACEYVFES